MVTAEFKYKLGKVERGYTNRTLYVNLSNMQITEKTVSEKMKGDIHGRPRFQPLAALERASLGPCCQVG